MIITKEQTVLLLLLKESLIGCTEMIQEELLSALDWETVMQESCQQAVALQVFDVVGKYRRYMPETVYQDWFRIAMKSMRNNLRVQQGQKELVQLLEKGGYPYVILKGTAAAAWYPRPELRTLGDVDFLIDPAHKEKLDQKLVAAGYVGGGYEHGCHVVYRKPGVHLEMHVEPAGIPCGESELLIREYLKDVPYRGIAYQFEGAEGYHPQAADHGLILLLHIQHHMLGSGLGLRHLCDWAVFVQGTYRQEFWENRLLPLLREIGLLRFAAVMTKVSAKYLGSVCPGWAYADETVVDMVIEDILIGGNFGRKEKTRARAGTMISNHGKNGVSDGVIWNLYHTLHRSSVEVYPQIKDRPILHFFVDVIRAMRYLLMTLCGKRPNLLKVYPYAVERKAIYEQLHIFETDETDK